ncbi:hypothetical protein [Flavobacterium psychrophilum]|nr:hypothetical protein [Flavobacterium psychrophilum]MEB3387964.1 hypothetical protein [Flavobacterium psychrophilum]MEB3399664.1 hypothetical protein [Flavobacterium psychrophilum]SNB43447.1 membrane hypothetical protein [Flavobacterium psychrophilum]
MSLSDFLLFVIFPLILASFLSFKGYTFESQLSNLIAGISIFGGFLFNLLAIIYSQLENIENNNNKIEDKNLLQLKEQFVNEIHANISFCIVLSIIIVLTLLMTTINLSDFVYSSIITKIIVGLNYFLLLIFLFSLLMVINRVYILLKRK